MLRGGGPTGSRNKSLFGYNGEWMSGRWMEKLMKLEFLLSVLHLSLFATSCLQSPKQFSHT